ncbi:MAG: ORF6N domain-containing protein [Elusimicrobiota bacterium]|nr:ORF6N domain-containing protein [Elusimicrobiota bacterium]
MVDVEISKIEGLIHVVRGRRVMLDSDLAALYGVATKQLNQAVRRNSDRFPDDFVLRLTSEEATALRSRFVTLDAPAGRGQHSKYLPLAFTEHGVAMLSSVLRSGRALMGPPDGPRRRIGFSRQG